MKVMQEWVITLECKIIIRELIRKQMAMKWKYKDLMACGRRICKCIKQKKGCGFKVRCCQDYKITPLRTVIITTPKPQK